MSSIESSEDLEHVLREDKLLLRGKSSLEIVISSSSFPVIHRSRELNALPLRGFGAPIRDRMFCIRTEPTCFATSPQLRNYIVRTPVRLETSSKGSESLAITGSSLTFL